MSSTMPTTETKTMRTFHWCGGCNGSGTAREPNIAPTYDERWRCPVCLGAGRISDQMPARDAECDAETLRANQELAKWGTRTREALAEIDEWIGHLVVDLFRVQGGLSTSADAVFSARLLSRAAFRAVPDLRGKE